MRRMALTTTATVTGIVSLLALKPHQAAHPAVSTHPPAGTDPASGSSGASRSGTFTGDVVDTRYGPVQVAVTMSAGRLTAVEVLQVPSENRRDREIASYAVPRLTDEAIGAQSAEIDAVSGATYTSEGYTRSLQSALDNARA
ncbi:MULTISPECIES: FMN-binding protein [unclassified Streptomyces]|uniref:FMN-binding protein n=2 Tax=Streptomyces TaxID=1883 RepID=UPI002E1128AF|nr:MULTISPECIES: FMN-binding protein [unclassified Streptomyces]WSR22841.1 FMN-binding protein [Streptomyces sp. NBC_01205]